MAENTIKIPGRLESVAIDQQLGGANQIYDDHFDLFQSDINYILINNKNELGKVASIVAFANFAGTPEETTNPEFEYVLCDASSHILLSINHDHEININVDLDEILTYIDVPAYGLFDLQHHILDSSVHISSENILKLAYISSFSTINGKFEESIEWKHVVLDASNHVLLGVNLDNQLKLYASIDEIFNIIELPEYSLIEDHDILIAHTSDSSIHITQEERDTWNSAQANVQSDWNETSQESDAYILNKPTSLPASDVSIWAKADNKPSYTASEVGLGNVTNDSQVKRSEMGVASGVATLDENGLIPSSQLPSYVDDVLEYDSSTSFPNPGESGKIYVDKSENKTYRWSGTIYVEISKSIVIGTTTGTAFDGGVGNTHVNDNGIHVTNTEKSTWNGKADVATTLSGYGITDAKISGGVITLGDDTITPLTSHQDISGKADKATTLSGYGITDAKISNGVITLGSNTITPLTTHQSVSDNNPTLSWGTQSKVATIGSTDIHVNLPANPNTDTKNTAGSTNSTNKLYIIGAESQSANPQTYSRSNCYIDASGLIYSGGYKALTDNDTLTEEEIGKAMSIIAYSSLISTPEKTTSPEWSYVLLDASSHVLFGINHDNEVKIYSDVDEILTYITSPDYGLIDVHDSLETHVNDTIVHVTSLEKSTWNGKANAATTLSGYGITDAKIASGVITLGSNTITPLTSHQDISGKADKATTLAGYGITDAKIASGVITLGTNTITPLTSHQSVTDSNPTLSWGTKSKVATIGSTDINVTMPANPNTDTKNTAGSTNNTSKLYLIGAVSQAANPQTYSRSGCYIDASGYLFSDGSRTITFDDTFTDDQIGVISAIVSMASNGGDISVETNPEYKWVVLDASSHILMGVKNDETFYSADIDVLVEALQIMVDNYSGQKSGTFANAPSNPYTGQQYFCTDKTATGGSNTGIPIWYNGTNWVDVIGTTIS